MDKPSSCSVCVHSCFSTADLSEKAQAAGLSVLQWSHWEVGIDLAKGGSQGLMNAEESGVRQFCSPHSPCVSCLSLPNYLFCPVVSESWRIKTEKSPCIQPRWRIIKVLSVI